MARPGNYRPLIYAGVYLGLGLGAAFEGIAFRQLLQWHGFLSSRVPLDTISGAALNLRWGGVLQAVSWLVALWGVRTLWRSARRGDVPWRGRALAGAFILGWGLYVCVEGMLFHHVLGLHHVVEQAPMPWRTYWDIAFLAWGASFLAIGGEMLRKDYEHFLHRRRQWKDGRSPLQPVTPPNSQQGRR